MGFQIQISVNHTIELNFGEGKEEIDFLKLSWVSKMNGKGS